MPVPSPELIFITDIERFGRERTLAVAQALCQGARPGTVSIQLRDKQLTSKERLQLALEFRGISSDSGQFLVVNDRLDLAVLAQADGIHLGEASLDPLTLRSLFPMFWLTCAWHSGEPRPGADAYLLSPVAAPRKGAAALGFTGLERRIQAFPGISVYALGGVDAVSGPMCLAAKAAGVAVSGAAYSDCSALLAALGIAVPAK